MRLPFKTSIYWEVVCNRTSHSGQPAMSKAVKSPKFIDNHLQDQSPSLSGSGLVSSQSLTSLSPYVMYSLNPSVETQHSNLSLPGPFQRARRGSDGSIYNQLQFPSTSNHGSMKRKKRSGVTQDGFRESEYYDNNVKIWSVEYDPRAFTATKKTVKV